MPSRSRDDAPLERGGEQAVVAAQQEPRRDVWPRGERPRRGERRAGLLAQVVRRLGDDVGGEVVEEDRRLVERLGRQAERGHRLGMGGALAGVRPPVAARLAGGRCHRRDQDDHRHGDPRGHDRRREPGHRLGDDHELGEQRSARRASSARDHGVGVLRETGAVVVARQVDGDRTVPAGGQQRLDPVPVPASRTRRRGGGRTWPSCVSTGSAAADSSVAGPCPRLSADRQTC